MLLSSAPALAAGGTVKLDCPAGTVQRGTRVSKDDGVFCVKAGAAREPGEPVAHGPYVDFHANGQKASEGQYQDGFRTGRWTFYDASGAKRGETEFSGGNYSGRRVEYHANGQVKREQHWVNGKRQGTETTYDAQGQKLTVTQLKDNRELRTERVGRAAK
jgi:hypothetical protein